MKNVKVIGKADFYGKSSLGEGSVVIGPASFGFPEGKILNELVEKNEGFEKQDYPGTVIGRNAVVRPGCTFYSNVSIGDTLRTGHNVMVRERTEIGNRVLLGTGVVIDGDVRIGSNVSIQSGVYIPTNSVIEDNVFMGPRSTITNDRYPVRPEKIVLEGATIRKGASIGACAVLVPGVEIGEGAMVGAGAVVTKDVAAWKIVAGNPAKVIKDVPAEYRVLNRI